jgi:putative transposase
MTKFNNKYRKESTRLKNWDYSWPGAYFVTILTSNRECYFGDLVDGKMNHNEIGKIAREEWLNTPAIRPDMNLELGEFVIMPNHFHGIITIGENEYNKITSLKTDNEVLESKIPAPQVKNLSSIIRGYKSSVTKRALLLNNDFKWHERFHDYVIRSHDEYLRISEYIRKNPTKWKSLDDFLYE